jgi:hypothetical protein
VLLNRSGSKSMHSSGKFRIICLAVLFPSIICSQGFSKGGNLPALIHAQSAVDNEG